MAPVIVGREAELAAIGRFLDAAVDGSALLLLAGEPGIGKTTLWAGGVDHAREKGYRVLAARPVEAETILPFTALGDLLQGIPDDTLSLLPHPQRRALDMALLRKEVKGGLPQPRAVALAVLGVLRRISGEGSVVVAVDDWQWLDPSSANALSFALRRLGREPVLFLASCLVDYDEIDPHLSRALGEERLHHLPVGRLSLDHLDLVLRSRLGAAIPRPILVQLDRITGGNPFFALEIARALIRRGAWPGPGESLPVPRNLRDLVRERLAGLPAAARDLALLISALSQPTTTVLETLGSGEGKLSMALAQAVEAGVVELDGRRIRFTHPLLSSVVYSEAIPATRRRLHGRLAQVVTDPEERARHQALSTEGPEPGIAMALDQAAERARRRGAPEAAAELLEQARRLTPPDHEDDALRRCVKAAEFWFEAGDATHARSILEEMVAASPPGPGRAGALSLLARIRGLEETGWAANRTLLEQALREAGNDLVLRGEIELGLAWVDHVGGGMTGAIHHAQEALTLADRSGQRSLLAGALAGVAFLQAISGLGTDSSLMDRALALEEEGEHMWASYRPRWLRSVMLEWAGRCDLARSILEPVRDQALETGDIQSLPFILVHLAREGCYLGTWDEATREAEEADRLAEQSGQWQERAFTLATRAILAAHRGDVAATRALVREGQTPVGRASSPVSTIARFELRATLGFLELSRGDPAEADRILGPLARDVAAAGIVEPGVFRFHANAIEALIELGQVGRARDLLDAFEVHGDPFVGVWTAATAARCRGLVRAAESDLGEAFLALEEALEHHDRLAEPFELGRTRLVLGVLQRRSKRRMGARESLRRALEVFDDLGAMLWSSKARAELDRIGGRVPDRWRLTHTERKVAELASIGRTNREIAASLYLSPKTVEVNLTRIYRKLGIRSRTELARRVPPEGFTQPELTGEPKPGKQ